MDLKLAPTSTPRPLKILLLSIFLVSIFSPFIGPYLVLSSSGIHHLYLWQFISYLFVHPFPTSLVYLIFNLYFLWTLGASLLERLKPPLFFTLYFGSGLAAALSAMIPMFLFHSPLFLAGSSSALYALLMSWILLNPDARLLLFFTISLKGYQILFLLIGINLLIDFSRADLVSPFSDLSATAFGYFFTLIACKARSPFSFLQSFANRLFRILENMKTTKHKTYIRSKIYDIKSGTPILNDDQFMDAMLARISLYGEENLTQEETKRMQNISNKKVAIRRQREERR